MAEKRGIIQTVMFPRVVGSFREIGGGAADTGISLAGSTYSSANVAAAGSLTCNVPAETVDGMQMLMHVGIQDDVDLLSQPTGWTRVTALDLSTIAGDDLRGNVYKRIASSEPASYEVATNHAASARSMNVIISVWNNVHADTFDVTPTTAHRATTQNVLNPSLPAITSVNDGAVMVCYGTFGFGGITTFGAQSGYDILESGVAEAVNGMLTSKLVVTAGLETPGVMTNTGTTPESIHSSLMLKLA